MKLAEKLTSEAGRIAQVERSTALIVTQDDAWRIVLCSDGWCDTMGYSREETIGRDLQEFFADDSQRELGKVERGAKPTDDRFARNASRQTHYEFATKSGAIRVMRLTGAFTGNSPDCVTTFLQDITAELEERAEKERALADLRAKTEELKAQSIELKRSLYEQKRLEETARTYLDISEGFSAFQNEKFEIIQMSQPMLDLLGYDRVEDLPETSALRADDLVNLSERRTEILATPVGVSIKPYTVSYWTKTGDKRTFQIRGKWYPTIDGHSRVLSSIFEDITLLQEQAEALERQAETDPLTGILNRLGLEKRLGDVQSSQRQCDWAICLIDLDWFKSVNDTFSHRAGDDLLKAVANTLATLVSKEGFAGRLGGEEFLVAEPWQSDEQARVLGEHVRQQIRVTEVYSGDHKIARTGSVGVARLRNSQPLGHALHVADIAMFKAKEQGRNKVIMADEAFIEEQRNNGAFVTELDIIEGLKNSEFTYYLQPIFNTKENQVEGFQALARWVKPDGTVLTPAAFMKPFNAVFYRPEYLELRQTMRRKVLQGLANNPGIYVSWNVDLERIFIEGFIDRIIKANRDLWSKSNVNLVMEISEAKFPERVDVQEIFPNLQPLRDAGVKIALNGFGSRQNNLSRLTELPLDIVKLDKSLIDHIEHFSRKRTVLEGIVLLLDRLEVEVIAEGVETSAQARILNELKIHKHQGWLYHKAMPVSEAVRLI